MLGQKSVVKRNRAGKVSVSKREIYYRDDIYSGAPDDPACPEDQRKLSKAASHYLVVDINVALSQIDFLEHKEIKDVVVCSTVLKEVREKAKSTYDRLRALCDNENKRFYVFSNENHR